MRAKGATMRTIETFKLDVLLFTTGSECMSRPRLHAAAAFIREWRIKDQQIKVGGRLKRWAVFRSHLPGVCRPSRWLMLQRLECIVTWYTVTKAGLGSRRYGTLALKSVSKGARSGRWRLQTEPSVLSLRWMVLPLQQRWTTPARHLQRLLSPQGTKSSEGRYQSVPLRPHQYIIRERPGGTITVRIRRMSLLLQLQLQLSERKRDGWRHWEIHDHDVSVSALCICQQAYCK